MSTAKVLVAAYKLENTDDEKGNYDLTNNNGVTFTLDGKFNKGANNGGVASHTLSRGDSIGTTLTGEKSISLWVKMVTDMSGANNQYNTIFSIRYGSPDYISFDIGYFRLSEVNKVAVGSSKGCVGSWLNYKDTDMGTTTFHNIILKTNTSGTKIKMYFDGTYVGEVTRAAGNGTCHNTATIISQADSGADWIIDDVVVWDREITTDEIATIWNSGTGLAYPFEVPAGPANLKSINGLAKASIKSRNSLAIGSIKSINGLE